MAAVRIARRRQLGWLRPVLLVTLALLGFTVLWNSIKYSTSHTALSSAYEEDLEGVSLPDDLEQELQRIEDDEVGVEAQARGAAGEQSGSVDDSMEEDEPPPKTKKQRKGGSGGATQKARSAADDARAAEETHANLAAWTDLTSLPKTAASSSSGGAGGSDGSGGAAGDAQQSAGGEQHQEGTEQVEEKAEAQVEQLVAAQEQAQEEQQAAAEEKPGPVKEQQQGGEQEQQGRDEGSGGDTMAAGAGASGKAGHATGFVSVELRVPKAPPTYNSWVLVEDMLLFHQKALQQQLEQLYIGMALAAATGRGFILPEFSCFCQASATKPLPRCRRPDSADLHFPTPCPPTDVLMPPEQFSSAGGGWALDVRPAFFEPKGKTLLLQPSATILWPACTKEGGCTKEEERPRGKMTVAQVPPSLNDTHLLPLLEPYESYSHWRLDLSDIGSPWHAFAGWECAAPAKAFDKRMSQAAKPWCCEVSMDGTLGQGLRQFNMTSGRLYSQEPDMKDC